MSEQNWEETRAQLLKELDETKKHLDAVERQLIKLISHKFKIDGHVEHFGLSADEAAEKMAETKARFEAMSFDEIMTYSRTKVEECLDNPWNFMYLFERFSVAIGERAEVLKEAKAEMIETIEETTLCLQEINELDEQAVSLQRSVKDEAAQLTRQILEAHAVKTKQDQCATKVSRQWQKKSVVKKWRGRHSGCTCQEQREASPQ